MLCLSNDYLTFSKESNKELTDERTSLESKSKSAVADYCIVWHSQDLVHVKAM